MPSVSPQLFSGIYGVSRWLFAFFALFLVFAAFSWLHSERKKHRSRFRSLPGAGNVGEMIVLSGSDQLAVNTWFPVPREGVLGSLRTCDLVVPCPGVHSRHLDFVWQDGTGLLLRPYSGCETWINGVPVRSASDAFSMPLVPGSTLQVGSAVLRLQVFAALDHTPRAAEAPGMTGRIPVPDPYPTAASDLPPVLPGMPVSGPAFFTEPRPDAPVYDPRPFPAPPAPYLPPEQADFPDAGETEAPVSGPADPVKPSAPPRRRRSDRWKEDWSE